MDEPTTSLFANYPKQSDAAPEDTARAEATTSPAEEPVLARGSGRITERAEHSIMEGLPEAKVARIAAMRRELADLQRQLIDAQQRIATELQGRVEDAERFEALEARTQAQELEATKNAARAAELEIEIMAVRSQLTSATAIADTLHGEVAARDAQLEDARRQHRDVTDQLEAQSSSLRDAHAQLELRTTERDAAQATGARLEGELEDQRKQHREVTEQLEHQFASLREAKATIETRDAALAAITSERDARASELEQARRELDTTRAKTNEIAQQLVRFGQALGDGITTTTATAQPAPVLEAAPVVEAAAIVEAAAVEDPPVERQAPPPLPPPRATASPAQVETIIEVTEAPSDSRAGAGLLAAGGVIVGCVVTFALMNSGRSAPVAAAQDHDTPRSSALVAPLANEAAPAPAADLALIGDPASASSTFETATAGATNELAPSLTSSPDIATDGVIVLPSAAARHRLFVDGKVVSVQRSRAVVPCGAHEVRIGSRGTPQTVDIACGGETTLSLETSEHE